MNRHHTKGYIDWDMILGIGCLALLVLIVVGAPIGNHFWNKATCHNRANLMQMDAQHSLMLGCMVKVGERWVPLHYVRINQNGDVSIVPGDEE